jgi:ribosomal protein S18 acetylase RimI-like enzyme
MIISPLTEKDLAEVKALTDRTIGLNYYSLIELQEVLKKSTLNGICSSFVLRDDAGIVQGFRLAFPPGTWSKGKGNKLRPDLWNVPKESVGYFQSLFLSEGLRGQSWGPKLSEAAIETFKKHGARAIVTHAWKESPQNSSVRYLTKFGFQSVATHPGYWKDVDYECLLDGKPCQCTAEEMIKYL